MCQKKGVKIPPSLQLSLMRVDHKRSAELEHVNLSLQNLLVTTEKSEVQNEITSWNLIFIDQALEEHKRKGSPSIFDDENSHKKSKNI